MKEAQQKESFKSNLKKFIGGILTFFSVYFIMQYGPDIVRFFYNFFK